MDWEPHDRHWIRLRGPWEAVQVDADGREGPAERIRLPADWGPYCRRSNSTVRFLRRFQQPTHLDPEERVLVTLTNFRTNVHATLNGRTIVPLDVPLGEPECWPAENSLSFDVTDVLETTNLLGLELQLPADESSAHTGLHEPVLLEIVTPDTPAE